MKPMTKPFKLSKSHVKLGRPLPWDVYDSAFQLLLSKGYIIDKSPQLESLITRGMYVDADEFESAQDQGGLVKLPQSPFSYWDGLVAKLAYQLTHAQQDKNLGANIVHLAKNIHLLNQRSPDAAIAAITLTMDQRRYSSIHCLHVAVLCDLVATRLQWEHNRRIDIICAALTMNIGMHELQQQLTNQRESLSAQQREAIRSHPLLSIDILRAAGVESTIWLYAVEHHHESPDGTGYPHGMGSPGEDAALLRTMDIYCAKISPRAYRSPISSTQAERVLFNEYGRTNPFIPALIKEIGIYPPGSFVKLANGEIGIVHKRSLNANTPHVISLTNPKGEILLEPIRRDTSREGCGIIPDVSRDKVMLSVDPTKIWQ